MTDEPIDTVAEATRRRECSCVCRITRETNFDAGKMYERVANHSGIIQYVRTIIWMKRKVK